MKLNRKNKRNTNEFRLEEIKGWECHDYMARDFFFEPPTLLIPDIQKLKLVWINIPNESVRTLVATEYQYYEFHQFLLDKLRHKDSDKPSYDLPLGLSVRVGAIKAARLVVGSITEAVLRAHAEQRGYKLHGTTLGKIIKIWEDKKIKEVDEILLLAKNVCEARNDVHLYQNIRRENDYKELLKSEGTERWNDNQLLKKLQALVSP